MLTSWLSNDTTGNWQKAARATSPLVQAVSQWKDQPVDPLQLNAIGIGLHWHTAKPFDVTAHQTTTAESKVSQIRTLSTATEGLLQ